MVDTASAIILRANHWLPPPNTTMDQGNLLQMLLLRGLGTTSLVGDRLRNVSQDWVMSGRLDPAQASALVDDVLKALRGETPEVEQQAERQLERNRDQLLQDLGLARQREVDELRGRIDRLEQTLRQRQANGDRLD
jgi:polyhydroxyalkanoate synthesis regulator phasin